jgi:prenyltransferase beta subunit
MPRFYRGSLGFVLAWVVLVASVSAAPPAKEPANKAVRAAGEKGLDWLTKNQAVNGSWGKTYTIAVTSFACLSYLSAAEEPYIDERGKALIKGLRFLVAQQKDGMFPQQGHTWIHGQGFATLALSEAYGRSLFCKTKPDADMKKIRAVVAQAVQAIGKNQSKSGGWWYTPGVTEQHEGSTTVCAVQAIFSAKNYGILVDDKVIDNGFEYLKKCQIKDGGFVYKLGDAVSMRAGTAGDVATLGLMQKFDFPVMIKGYKFLAKLTPAGISRDNFVYYGHFYGCMAMRLLGQEYKDDKEFRENTAAYIAGVQKDLISWQTAEGVFPFRPGVDGNTENAGYPTAFATLALFVPEGRLSIYNRTPPTLPKDK